MGGFTSAAGACRRTARGGAAWLAVRAWPFHARQQLDRDRLHMPRPKCPPCWAGPRCRCCHSILRSIRRSLPLARACWSKQDRWALALAFAACWIVTEWLRAWVFTGYAWNPFGDHPAWRLLAPRHRNAGAMAGDVCAVGHGGADRRGGGLVLLARRLVVAAGLPRPLTTPARNALARPAGNSRATLRYTLVQPDIRPGSAE